MLIVGLRSREVGLYGKNNNVAENSFVYNTQQHTKVDRWYESRRSTLLYCDQKICGA